MTFRHAVAIAFSAAVCLGTAVPAGGRSPEANATPADLATINRSIQQLVEILRIHLTQRDQDFELRRIEVAIAALDLRSSAILQMEDRLLRIQTERENADQRRSRMRQQIAEFEERLRSTNQTTDGQTHLNLAHALERLTAESELIENTIWDLDRRILDLQNQIARERESLLHLEEMVDEALDSF
jgi:predicted  nucleic acid-binding Zn-ribbon protein